MPAATRADPTYRSLGDHTETIQIDYDPAQISYEELLDVFWDSHDPAPPWSQAVRLHDLLPQRGAEPARR